MCFRSSLYLQDEFDNKKNFQSQLFIGALCSTITLTDDAAAKAVRMENRERNRAESECHPDKDLGKAIRKGLRWRC